MSGCANVLGLLHPDGVAPACLVLGGNCPTTLRPPQGDTLPPWDLLIVAPTAHEADDPAWIAALRQAGGALAHDGLAYVLAGPRVRPRMARLLAEVGLATGVAMLHLPDTPTSTTLIPLARPALRAAAESVAPPGAARRILRLGAELPGWGLVVRVHRSVALILRRPGTRPLAAWAAPARDHGGSPMAALRLRRNAYRERAVIDLVPVAGRATVAKIVVRGGSDAQTVGAEAASLAGARASALAAGVDIPLGETRTLGPGCEVLLLDRLPGTPASQVVRGDAGAAGRVIARVAEWLERWHVVTVTRERLGAQRLSHEVLTPAARLADQIRGGPAYVRWLEDRCRAVEDTQTPLVYVHGDLTMSNVLVRAAGPLAVVDWEAARPAGFPLGDFVYAAVDAVAAGERYRDRAAAFDRCFRVGHSVGRSVRQACGRLRRAIDLSPDAATIAFHACWLSHATNESRKRGPGERRPFLELLQRAADGRETIAPWSERA